MAQEKVACVMGSVDFVSLHSIAVCREQKDSYSKHGFY